MMPYDNPARSDRPPKLSLRPREAAEAIGISARLLWTLTKKGEIPHLRLGRAVVYPVDGLQQWLADRSRENNPPVS